MLEVELRETLAKMIGDALASGWSINRRECYVKLCETLEKLAESERR